MAFSYLLLLLLLHPSIGWECGGTHDHIEFGPSHNRMLYPRSTTYGPIRILFYFMPNFNLGSSTLNTYIQTITIPQVNSFYTHALSVYQVQGSLSFSGASTCGPEVTIPAAHLSPGVTNTDIIIYITSETTTGMSYVSYSGACLIDSQKNNVVAGRIVMNAPNYQSLTPEERYMDLTHAMTHILGFSPNLFPYWTKSNGSTYNVNTEILSTVTLRGTTKTWLITPTVQATARLAFNCSTLPGVELEDQGGTLYANSHWEERTMFNDYMISRITDGAIYSNITLALLQDTGWYKVDFSMGQAPIFGRNVGCGFFNTKCVVNGVSQYPNMFCDTPNSWTCDPMGLSKAQCNIATWSAPLSTWFQYFSTSTTGGYDYFSDYCPYKQMYTNGDCRGNSVATYVQSGTSEVIGMSSRCFASTLLLNPFYFTSSYSACYSVISCTSTSATV